MWKVNGFHTIFTDTSDYFKFLCRCPCFWTVQKYNRKNLFTWVDDWVYVLIKKIYKKMFMFVYLNHQGRWFVRSRQKFSVATSLTDHKSKTRNLAQESSDNFKILTDTSQDKTNIQRTDKTRNSINMMLHMILLWHHRCAHEYATFY